TPLGGFVCEAPETHSTALLTFFSLIRLSQKAALTDALVLDTTDTIKIALTTKEDGKAKRPHQAFVIIREEDTGLEAPFAFNLRGNGKGSIEIVCSQPPSMPGFRAPANRCQNLAPQGAPRSAPPHQEAP